MDLINLNTDKLNHLCEKHKVEKLFVFGSVLTEKFNSESDIDLIVEFGEINLYEYANNYFDLKESLEEIFNREVDLVEGKAIKNPYFKESVEATRKLIYG